RQAIMDANASAGPHTIQFNILPADGIKTIKPMSPLPQITQQVTIDGTSQPNYFGTPVIELDGSMAGISLSIGLDVGGGGAGSIIRGLTINRFSISGIDIHIGANDCLIEYCFIGTDSSGTTAAGNGDGIGTAGSHTMVRNCVLSGNRDRGILFVGAAGGGGSNSQVTDSIIGLSADGTAAVPNGSDGIVFGGGV